MDRKEYLAELYSAEDRKLIKLFQKEMQRLNLLYFRAISSNDIAKAQELMEKIKTIAKTLKSEYSERADLVIPKEYLKGSKYIDDVLNGTDTLSIILSADKKDITSMIKEMGPVHIDAVNALLNTSKNYVKSSLDGMERQALTMLGELQQEKVRESLAGGMISGEGLSNLKRRVQRYFEANKITGFKDRAGRVWSMDRYVDMLTRTETSIANVQGTINRAIQLGITKFKVVENQDCCENCAKENGKIVDVKDGVVELPPFHPNCRGYIIAQI